MPGEGLGCLAVFGGIGITAPEANQPCLLSLTPNFSWVAVAPEELQPLQRSAPAAARTGQGKKTAEAVGARAGPQPPN
jgi:hypothetical protein